MPDRGESVIGVKSRAIRTSSRYCPSSRNSPHITPSTTMMPDWNDTLSVLVIAGVPLLWLTGQLQGETLGTASAG